MTKSCAVSMGWWTPNHWLGSKKPMCCEEFGRRVVGWAVGGDDTRAVQLGDCRLREVDRIGNGPGLERDGGFVGRGEDDGQQDGQDPDGQNATNASFRMSLGT